ncbi:MAG: hypothetical protein E4H36_15480 [Spirochaetales bacterium]|nr:MAG: hypothetical protein E4H36_15480 [Spirochaetales bacterium]
MVSELSGLERVLAALSLEEPDRVPTFEWSINGRVRETLFPGSSPFGFADKAGLDGVVVYEDQQKENTGSHGYRDEWGITYAETEEDYPTAVGHPLESFDGQAEDIAVSLTIPDPQADWRFESLREAVKRFKGRKAIVFRLRDAFSLPRNLRGMQNLMIDFVLNPDLVRQLTDISIDFNIKTAYRAMELGADIFWTSDDYCDNRGPTMGPEIWREFILPGLRRLVQTIRKEGYHFIKHNDGNIRSILPEMADTGISCIDPIDTGAGMDLAETKQNFGSRLAIKGGFPAEPVLCRGAREDVEEEVKRCLKAAAYGGGYILSTSSDIISSVKPENYLAMLEANRKYGTYPLRLD